MQGHRGQTGKGNTDGEDWYRGDDILTDGDDWFLWRGYVLSYFFIISVGSVHTLLTCVFSQVSKK